MKKKKPEHTHTHTKKEMFLSIIKAMNVKPTANIIYKGEKLKTSPLRLGTRYRCTFLLLFFNIVLEIIARLIKKKKQKSSKLERKK